MGDSFQPSKRPIVEGVEQGLGLWAPQPDITQRENHRTGRAPVDSKGCDSPKQKSQYLKEHAEICLYAL